MGRDNQVPETGTVINRYEGPHGPMICVAVTMPGHIWDRLTAEYVRLWREAEDDLDFRELTREELIALFVTHKVDGWYGRAGTLYDPDFAGDLPL